MSCSRTGVQLVIDIKGGVTADIKARIGKARQSFGRLKPVWRASNLTKKTKLRIFNSNVKSVLLYGSETWCLTKVNENRLQTFINKCLRYILGIWYPERISNQELLERTAQEPVADVIRKRKWGWLGHTLRRPMSLGGPFIGTLRVIEIGEDQRTPGGENWRLK